MQTSASSTYNMAAKRGGSSPCSHKSQSSLPPQKPARRCSIPFRKIAFCKWQTFLMNPPLTHNTAANQKNPLWIRPIFRGFSKKYEKGVSKKWDYKDLNMPLFTVITSVYNKEKYISKCILSVLNQKFSDFNYIILNDGSTDASEEIIKRQIHGNSRCHLITRENKGFSTTMEELFNIADGEYIINVDADDWIEEDLLYEINKILEQLHFYPDIVDFKSYFAREDGVVFSKEKLDYHEALITKDLYKFYKDSNFIPFVTYTRKAIKKTFLQKIKILNPAYACDRYIMIEICSNISSYYYSEKYLYNIRFQHTTLSANYIKDKDYYITDLNRIYSTLRRIEGKIHYGYMPQLECLFRTFIDSGFLKNVPNCEIRKLNSRFFYKYRHAFCKNNIKLRIQVFMFCRLPHLASFIFSHYWKMKHKRN